MPPSQQLPLGLRLPLELAMGLELTLELGMLRLRLGLAVVVVPELALEQLEYSQLQLLQKGPLVEVPRQLRRPSAIPSLTFAACWACPVQAAGPSKHRWESPDPQSPSSPPGNQGAFHSYRWHRRLHFEIQAQPEEMPVGQPEE